MKIVCRLKEKARKLAARLTRKKRIKVAVPALMRIRQE